MLFVFFSGDKFRNNFRKTINKSVRQSSQLKFRHRYKTRKNKIKMYLVFIKIYQVLKKLWNDGIDKFTNISNKLNRIFYLCSKFLSKSNSLFKKFYLFFLIFKNNTTILCREKNCLFKANLSAHQCVKCKFYFSSFQWLNFTSLSNDKLITVFTTTFVTFGHHHYHWQSSPYRELPAFFFFFTLFNYFLLFPYSCSLSYTMRKLTFFDDTDFQ